MGRSSRHATVLTVGAVLAASVGAPRELPLVARLGAQAPAAPERPLASGLPARIPIARYLGADTARLPAAIEAFGRRGMVVSNDSLASAAGREMLAAGGNAVDAAVATAFALAVTFPTAGNLGGGGFLVVRLASGQRAALDFRETAPAAASRDMYLDSAGNLTNARLLGHRASGVPGSVAGLLAAQRRFGRLPRRRVMAPAIRLARDGFVVDPWLARDLAGYARPILTPFAGASLFYPDGQPLAAGARLVQRDLARTLERIAARGAEGFYRGPVADALVEEMRRGGGLITHADLAAYRPRWRAPIVGTYRGHTILSMPPVSSGGTTMVETLNILERFPALPPLGSARYAHLVAEAFRRAFTDRNERLGDPDFVRNPVDTLTSKAYAARLHRAMDTLRATPSAPGPVSPEPPHTTHLAVADAQGGVVSLTTTINGGYGSGVWIPGGGFLMNNEMDDFAAKPGVANRDGLVMGARNAIGPGKRMLSSMTPTIVLDPKGRVLLAVGAAGSQTIISASTQVILNVVDHRLSLGDAMRAPRIHHQAIPDLLDHEMTYPGAALDSLRVMGHRLQTQFATWPNVNALLRVRSGWIGVREPRGPGAAIGYR